MNRRRLYQKLGTMGAIIQISVGVCSLNTSCGHTSNVTYQHNPQESEAVVEENDYDEAETDSYDREYTPNMSEDDKANMGNIQLTGEIVQCNKCMGYGMVQDGMSGQPEICKFCWMSTWMRQQQGWNGFDGRYGWVDAVFNTLPADYFDELDWNAGNDVNNDDGNDRNQIEAEIEQHEENIARLEHMLEYIDGTTVRTQIEQQIIEERYEIKRLRSALDY